MFKEHDKSEHYVFMCLCDHSVIPCIMNGCSFYVQKVTKLFS